MWNEKIVLIKKDTLELPHKDGGIQLVNVPLKVQSFKIEHIFQLLYGISSHPWKSLAKYWLGIKLKAMKLFTVVNDWTGPFAETPNDYYQKCFEIFKAFISKLNTLDTDGNIQYNQLTVKDIYQYLIQFRDIKSTVEVNNPTIDFTPIYKEITTIKTTSWDYDLAYKIAHRAINTRVKLKKIKLILLDTCPLCSNILRPFIIYLWIVLLFNPQFNTLRI